LRLAPAPLEHLLRSAAERYVYSSTPVIHALPPAFHYWSNTYLRPRFEAIGFSSPDDFYHCQLRALAAGRRPLRCLSLGAGRCELEIALAVQLAGEAGDGIRFVCTDLNPRLLQAAASAAQHAGVADRFEFITADVRRLPAGQFDAVIANQCLHHFVELEAVLDGIHAALADDGLLLTSDVIGRNGHRMWPEALDELQRIWRSLPPRLRHDPLTDRVLAEYDNFDCADVGFEGIRAQDILPLLIERFHFSVFAPFACIVIPFIDRRFGGNFDPDIPDDRATIDRIACRDQDLLDRGVVKPTQLVAAMGKQPAQQCVSLTTLEPTQCIRLP
jgi:SAM-dependent methyltransferase